MKETEPTDTCKAMACGRQSGRAVLQDTIDRLRKRADALQRLSDMLPAKPTPEQDEAIWMLACDIPRF